MRLYLVLLFIRNLHSLQDPQGEAEGESTQPLLGQPRLVLLHSRGSSKLLQVLTLTPLHPLTLTHTHTHVSKRRSVSRTCART